MWYIEASSFAWELKQLNADRVVSRRAHGRACRMCPC